MFLETSVDPASSQSLYSPIVEERSAQPLPHHNSPSSLQVDSQKHEFSEQASDVVRPQQTKRRNSFFQPIAQADDPAQLENLLKELRQITNQIEDLQTSQVLPG